MNMDVTYGLLMHLVKTKSIQRILAPIASQISLLIILNESEDGSHIVPVDMVPCSKAVMEASNKLIIAAKQQAHASTDKDFISQTLSACEVLELSCNNLLLAAQRLEADGRSKEARNKLVQASKDILQGTMKVLLVADDSEIRRLITASQIVEDKLGRLKDVNNMQQLVVEFKEFTEALSSLTSLTDKRQRELLHGKQRERIITALNLLKKSVASLSSALQTSIKYGANSQAGKMFVVSEIQQGLHDIVEAIQNRDSPDDPGAQWTFITKVDQVLEALSSEARDQLHPDFEIWTEEMVRHSMMVAHLCYDTHREIIVHTCQRVIQLKMRLVDMQSAIYEGQESQQTRSDYMDTCETLIDEVCELEKNVNVSLLHLVVEVFKETTQPLERLVKKAISSNKIKSLDMSDQLVTDFVEHAEKLCQIALLAAASSTDARRIQEIRSSVQRLESLDPELVSMVISASRLLDDKGVTRHLKLLMNEWTFELTNVVRVLDIMTDPKMFMLVSERKVEEDINTCRGCIIIRDLEGFTLTSRSLIGRCRRVAQVAEGIVDGSCDPLFRNGLMVFIQQLKKAITGVRSAASDLEQDLSHHGYQDTLKRRFLLLQDCLIRVKSGLSGVNHPHVLSPLRRNIRNTSITQYNDSVSFLKSKSQTVTPEARLRGDHIISTSVPSLSHVQPETHRDSPVISTTSVYQYALPGQGSSGIDIKQNSDVPQTFAWELSKELISWATKGDKQRVNLLCGEFLGWTNHIVDVCQATLVHCTDCDKKRDLESLCYDVDQLASSLLDSVKYVLHGDFSQLQGTRHQAQNWATKVEKVRVYVDITVDEWKTFTDQVCQAAVARKQDLVLHTVEKVQGHQQAVCGLVELTSRFRWEGKVKGHGLETLWQSKNDLENLTVTFKTTTTMMSEQDQREQCNQCDQLGREWSVKIYCMLTSLRDLADTLLAQGSNLWPYLIQTDNITGYMAGENSRLKDLLRSACYSDSNQQTVYKELLADMTETVEDLKTASLRKKVTSASNVYTHQYTNLRTNLHKAFWVLKASQCVDIARQQTYDYSGTVDQLIDKAFQVLAATGEAKAEEETKLRDLINQLSQTVAEVRRKVLSALQLSAELSRRSVVRQCLDSLNNLLPEVVSVVKALAGTDGCSVKGNHSKVSWLRLLWSAKVRHLVVALQEVSDVKATLVSGIVKVLKTDPGHASYETISHKLSVEPGLYASSDPGISKTDISMTIGTAKHVIAPSPSVDDKTSTQILESSLKNINMSSPCHTSKVTSPSNTSPSHLSNKVTHGSKVKADLFSGGFYDDAKEADAVNFNPVVVDMAALEDQIMQNARKAKEKDAATVVAAAADDSTTDISTEQVSKMLSCVQINDSPARKAYQHPTLPTLNLDHVRYVEHVSPAWEEDSNPVVQVARTMAAQLYHLQLYMRREGPITSHLGLVKTTKALSENSAKIVQFADILIRHCVDQSFCADLVSYKNQVATVIRQLTILANAQLGTSQSDTTSLILVQNSENLMKKIQKLMDACEAVSVKGLSDSVSKEDESAVALATRWRQKHQEHRHRGNIEMSTDELGLRIVEDERSTPALNQMFKSPLKQ